MPKSARIGSFRPYEWTLIRSKSEWIKVLKAHLFEYERRPKVEDAPFRYPCLAQRTHWTSDAAGNIESISFAFVYVDEAEDLLKCVGWTSV